VVDGAELSWTGGSKQLHTTRLVKVQGVLRNRAAGCWRACARGLVPAARGAVGPVARPHGRPGRGAWRGGRRGAVEARAGPPRRLPCVRTPEQRDPDTWPTRLERMRVHQSAVTTSPGPVLFHLPGFKIA
jgi:hypothetical protein